jgi:hypothetical protein
MNGENTNRTACPIAAIMSPTAAQIAAVAVGFTALSMFTFVAGRGSANAADMTLPQRTYRPV